MDENRRNSTPVLQYWAKLKKNVYVLNAQIHSLYFQMYFNYKNSQGVQS